MAFTETNCGVYKNNMLAIFSVLKWCINIFLKILVLKKRNSNIWLFGSWNGESYSDNSKFFFEYVVKNHPTINPIWITKSKHIKNKLLSENKKCYL